MTAGIFLRRKVGAVSAVADVNIVVPREARPLVLSVSPAAERRHSVVLSWGWRCRASGEILFRGRAQASISTAERKRRKPVATCS